MELKKSNKANLEKSRGIFFEIGLLFALGFVFGVFEMTVSPQQEEEVVISVELLDMEDTPITRDTEPPPPPPEPPKVADILDIVSDDVTVDHHIEINVDVDLMTAIDIFTFDDTDVEEEEEIILFAVIEDKPLFNGQDPDVAFRAWAQGVVNYPPVAAENGITGRVIAEFVIDTDGRLTDIRILRSPDPLLENEILRALRLSPRWSPGQQRGRAVKVRYQFPFTFNLQ
jgi:protein TonB